jgi:hypothetical protein
VPRVGASLIDGQTVVRATAGLYVIVPIASRPAITRRPPTEHAPVARIIAACAEDSHLDRSGAVHHPRAQRDGPWCGGCTLPMRAPIPGAHHLEACGRAAEGGDGGADGPMSGLHRRDASRHRIVRTTC